jgi:fumarate reductase flavoprotein subunit
MPSERYDLVICGAGAAGMPCAIAAAEQGARVVVIEKAAEIGGTLHVAGGHVSAAGTRLQAELGIEDTPDSHYDDVMRICGNTADPALLRLAVDEAGPLVDWLHDLGFPFDPEAPQPALIYKPYSVARLYWGEAPGQKGPVILRTIRPEWDRHVAAGRITVLLEHALAGLVVEDGRVAGIRATGPDGAGRELRGDAVVLATGGYGSSPDLFAELTPGAPQVLALARPAATGDGIRAALDLGAEVRGADRFLLNYGVLPAEPGSTRGASRSEGIDLRPERPRREIWVNEAGERFVAEDVQSLAAQHDALRAQPGQRAWVVLDEACLREGPQVHLAWDSSEVRRRAAEGRVAWLADSPDALARRAGLDPAALARTIEAWNAACAAGSDPLGRTTGLVPLAEPPYVAIEMRCAATVTFGGLAVDGELRVVDAATREPIPGLFAAGEILGGATTSGRSYTGGMLLTPALAFGRLLGRRLGASAAAAATPAAG